jgi:hypothetical protein
MSEALVVAQVEEQLLDLGLKRAAALLPACVEWAAGGGEDAFGGGARHGGHSPADERILRYDAEARKRFASSLPRRATRQAPAGLYAAQDSDL